MPAAALVLWLPTRVLLMVVLVCGGQRPPGPAAYAASFVVIYYSSCFVEEIVDGFGFATVKVDLLGAPSISFRLL